MGTVLAAGLSLLLLVPTAWAIQPGPGAEIAPSPDVPGSVEDELQLLVPVEAMADFEAALSSDLAAEIVTAIPPERVWLEGREYVVLGFPAVALRDLYEEIGDKPFHDDLKVGVSEGEWIHVTDLSALEFALGIGPTAPAGTV
jgi:hypothetical protein